VKWFLFSSKLLYFSLTHLGRSLACLYALYDRLEYTEEYIENFILKLAAGRYWKSRQANKQTDFVQKENNSENDSEIHIFMCSFIFSYPCLNTLSLSQCLFNTTIFSSPPGNAHRFSPSVRALFHFCFLYQIFSSFLLEIAHRIWYLLLVFQTLIYLKIIHIFFQ